MTTWQELAATDLDKEDTPHLRMSAAGHCPAALAYAALGLPETDPPDEDSENRMALGHMAEILIIRGLEKRGWETKRTVLDGGQLELEITLTPEWSQAEPQIITGHPDGICRHPEFTKGHWVTLECKSMSPDRAVEVEQYGVAAVYPSYLIQAALYSQRLYEMGEVVHPRRAVFGMMDREGRMLPPERVSWPEEVAPGTIDKLTMISFQTQQGEVPFPPYPQDSSECRYCNYYQRCWKAPPDFGGKYPSIVRVDDPDLDVYQAANLWVENKPVVDAARDVLQKASNAVGSATIEVNGVLAGYFFPREAPAYDSRKLEEMLPGDILRECLAANQKPKQPPFWVRLARK